MEWRTESLGVLLLMVSGLGATPVGLAQPPEGAVEHAEGLDGPTEGAPAASPTVEPRFSPSAVAEAQRERELAPRHRSRRTIRRERPRRTGGAIAMVAIGFGLAVASGVVFGLVEGLRCWDLFGTDPCGPRPRLMVPIFSVIAGIGLILGIVGVTRLPQRSGRGPRATLDARGVHF